MRKISVIPKFAHKINEFNLTFSLLLPPNIVRISNYRYSFCEAKVPLHKFHRMHLNIALFLLSVYLSNWVLTALPETETNQLRMKKLFHHNKLFRHHSVCRWCAFVKLMFTFSEFHCIQYILREKSFLCVFIFLSNEAILKVSKWTQSELANVVRRSS